MKHIVSRIVCSSHNLPLTHLTVHRNDNDQLKVLQAIPDLTAR